jgi:hypothetical protein
VRGTRLSERERHREGRRGCSGRSWLQAPCPVDDGDHDDEWNGDVDRKVARKVMVGGDDHSGSDTSMVLAAAHGIATRVRSQTCVYVCVRVRMLDKEMCKEFACTCVCINACMCSNKPKGRELQTARQLALPEYLETHCKRVCVSVILCVIVCLKLVRVSAAVRQIADVCMVAQE